MNNMASLKLQIGDQIVWKDTEIKGEGPAVVSPGMKGQVLSLHDGAHLDVIEGGTLQASAVVQFENGASLLVDRWRKWEKVSKG